MVHTVTMLYYCPGFEPSVLNSAAESPYLCVLGFVSFYSELYHYNTSFWEIQTKVATDHIFCKLQQWEPRLSQYPEGKPVIESWIECKLKNKTQGTHSSVGCLDWKEKGRKEKAGRRRAERRTERRPGK